MSAPQSTPGRGHSTGSSTATALLSVVTVLAGCGSLYLSLFFAMAADACSSIRAGATA
jgi:hypothetical protein